MAKIQFNIRPATDADRDFAFQAWKAAMQQYVEATWGWDEVSQRQRQREEFEPAAYQIVEVAGQSAGTLITKHRSDHLYLSGIYLLPEHQGQGIGSHLLTSLLTESQSQGKQIHLRVLKVNSKARHLYESMGFVVTDETEADFVSMRFP